MSDLQYFARVSGDSALRAWLEQQRVGAIKYLTEATEITQIHRAQGRVRLIDEILENMAKAKGLS